MFLKELGIHLRGGDEKDVLEHRRDGDREAVGWTPCEVGRRGGL